MRRNSHALEIPVLAGSLLGEILSKRWTETAIPVFVLLIVGFALSHSIDNFLSSDEPCRHGEASVRDRFHRSRQALVVIVGGIDLSVGSMFALTDFCALYTLDVLGWPVAAVALATIVCGVARSEPSTAFSSAICAYVPLSRR